MNESRFPRIYACAPDRLSDVVMCLPALRHLTERHPDASVDVWCPFAWAPLLESADLSATVIPYRGRRSLWKTAAWVRDVGYDVAYLFSRSFHAAAVAWLGGIPQRRVTPGTHDRRRLNGHAAPQRGATEHRTALYMRTVEPDWNGAVPPRPRLSVSDRAREQFMRLVAGRFARPAVAIVPGSSRSARRWPQGNFTALAGMLGEEVGSVVVFGDREDEVLAARVAAGAGRRGVDLGGRTSLNVLVAGLATCDLVITNDNGPMHLAAAVDRPLICIFGSSDPSHTGPLSASACTLHQAALPCAPCRRDKCPRHGVGTFLPEAHEECLRLVTVEAVARAARRELQKVGSSRDV